MADEPVQESMREQRRADRLQQARGTVTPERVRVLPRDEAFRKSHRNVVGHANFPEQGSVEWPFDQFTKRRLRDGDITIEAVAPEVQQRAKEPEPKEAKATRNQPPTPSTS
jgi:hypothetical protein